MKLKKGRVECLDLKSVETKNYIIFFKSLAIEKTSTSQWPIFKNFHPQLLISIKRNRLQNYVRTFLLPSLNSISLSIPLETRQNQANYLLENSLSSSAARSHVSITEITNDTKCTIGKGTNCNTTI